MLIRELSNWPPVVGGGHEAGCEFPKLGEGVLSGVYPANDDRVTFSCRFEGHDFNCHLKARSLELAEKITEALSQNVGKALTELGALKVN